MTSLAFAFRQRGCWVIKGKVRGEKDVPQHCQGHHHGRWRVWAWSSPRGLADAAKSNARSSAETMRR